MTLKAPFPYFGGKHRAAPLIWEAFGDPGGYVEPFCGSAAVLLARPPLVGRRVETLNDADGWLVNAWRSIQLSPDAVARATYGPMTEIDYHARLAWLQARRDADLVAWLEGDPEHHDAKAAGWWLYVVACAIGGIHDSGPWIINDGHLVKDEQKSSSGIPRAMFCLNGPRGTASLGDDTERVLTSLSHRLRHVRITCGDWSRVVTDAARSGKLGGDGSHAIFFDPPYDDSMRVYSEQLVDVASDVRNWCMQADAKSIRIIICGFDDEHDALLERGWTKRVGKATTGGHRQEQGKRERLWLSPACLTRQTRMELGI